MIDGLKRGKWLAGRTVGMVQRVASTTNAMRPDEWEALSEAVETYANQAVNEAVVAAMDDVLGRLFDAAVWDVWPNGGAIPAPVHAVRAALAKRIRAVAERTP